MAMRRSRKLLIVGNQEKENEKMFIQGNSHLSHVFAQPVHCVARRSMSVFQACADHKHALPYKDAITRHVPAFDA